METKNEIRALSWKQPYASLMLHGKIETRSWSTKYRGKVLICASKKPYYEIELLGISGDVQTQRIFELINSKGMKEPTGKAIAIGELVDCRQMEKEDEQKTFVKYRPGLWCHVYDNVRPICPFNWKGTQGWKKLDYFQKLDVRLALEKLNHVD
jgi:hypothetical protein